MNPVARRDDLIVQQVGTDVLVYDQLRDNTHALNPTSAAVFRLADGTRTPREIAAALEEEALPVDETHVEAALVQLAGAGLLEPEPGGNRKARSVTRRQAVRRLGAAALAAPTITTILAPTPLMAQSACKYGSGSCSVSYISDPHRSCKSHRSKPSYPSKPKSYGSKPSYPSKPKSYGSKPSYPSKPKSYGSKPKSYGSKPKSYGSKSYGSKSSKKSSGYDKKQINKSLQQWWAKWSKHG